MKTCMRSSMTQERLDHCAVLHVHQHKLGALDIDEIAREFGVKLTREELRTFEIIVEQSN